MWTYKRPYTPQELTKTYIERRGQVALSRALSIGRVIGFVGSGATGAYGRGDWDGLVNKAVAVAIEFAKASPDSDSPAIISIINILERYSGGDNKMQTLGLAENLAVMVGQETAFREALGRFFSGERAQKTPPQAKNFNGAQPLRRLISDLGVNRLLTLNYDPEIEEEFRRLYRSGGTSRKHAPTNPPEKGTEPLSDFDMLCSGGFDRARELPKRIEYCDGTTRSVLSVSLGSTNIGELVNFALHPRQFVGQVFHLHGRYDKPQDMVLTDEDYRSTYLKSDAKAQEFEEALTALLTGNDILFVGTGMSEDDLLRPLRQFINQDKTPEFAQRHIFAMMENKVSLDMKWLQRPHYAAFNAFKDFKDNHIGSSQTGRPKKAGALQSDFDSDEAQAVRLRTEYGVYTLYHGGQNLRRIRLAIMLLRAGLKPRTGKGPFETNAIDKDSYSAALRAIKQDIDNLNTVSDGPNLPEQLLFEDEIGKLRGLLALAIWTVGWAGHGLVSWRKPQLDALETEARSRALELVLLRHNTRRADWWHEWRTAPKPREPEYQRRYHGKDEFKTRPNVARHRPVYKSLSENKNDFRVIKRLQELAKKVAKKPAKLENTQETDLKGGHIKPFDSNGLSYFKSKSKGGFSAGEQRSFQDVPPKRILRAAMPRGFGKGSLLHLLEQDIPDENRLILDTLFYPKNENFRYHGSFCLHLSFSMEFSSVITALKIFIEQALNGIFSEHPQKVLDCAHRLKPGENDTFLAFLYKSFNQDCDKNSVHTVEKSCLGEILLKLEAAASGKKTAPSKELSDFITEHYWNIRKKANGIGHMHRLEELRGRISAFTDCVDLIGDENIRLFIAMSGIDRLCDNNGVAYNPMYRALFRMLTGCGAKYPSESDITSPIDYFLLAGVKHRPIRYLSDEYSAKQLKSRLKRPVKPKKSDYYASYPNYRQSYGARYLKDWPDLQPFGLDERYWFADRSKGKEFIDRLAECEPIFREITHACQNGVALSSWCAGAYQASHEGAGKLDLDRYLTTLNGAFARGGLAMVLSEVLEVHKTELRAWGQVLFKEGSTDEKWPPLSLRKKRHKYKGIYSSEANRLVDLTYLILSHLALFPMPVEPKVLLGCDEIYDLLKQVCGPNAATQATQQHKLLSQVLDYLRKAHLIIAVRKKSHENKDTKANASLRLGSHPLGEDDIHTRFTVQHQLRDYAARLMDLSVPDQGERNFFQVSIYCDQPRDLPSPRPEHYRLVRSIMERQITQTRNTIWSMMQLTRQSPPLNTLDKDQKKLAESGIKKALSIKGTTEFDPHLRNLHAIPQQVRALYGLMRSGFSVGTISRLPELNERKLDQPYERFRGWLRGVTNAAIGWDHLLANEMENPKALLDKVNNLDLGLTVDTKPIIKECPGFAQPLYRDEIGWLLNERGLISLVQGHIFDALPLFQRALDMMHHDDNTGIYDPSLHAAVRRVRLNMAIALIDRGHLDRAATILHDLQLPEDLSAHNGSTISWLAQGYLGLIQHLSGNLQQAESAYDKVIQKASEREMTRVVAVFSKHWADSLRCRNELDLAKEKIATSIAAAQQSAQQDILYLARVSQANIELADPNGNMAFIGQSINETVKFAQQMGLPRLEGDALYLQASLMLKQGDRMLAGTFASRAAAIGNRHGLRLNKLRALKVYANALHNRGQLETAARTMRETNREAERRGYQSLTRSIDDTSRFS